MIFPLLLLFGALDFTFSAPVVCRDELAIPSSGLTFTAVPTVPATVVDPPWPGRGHPTTNSTTTVPTTAAVSGKPSYYSLPPHPTWSTHHSHSIPRHTHTHPSYTSILTMDPVDPSATHSSGWGFPTSIPSDLSAHTSEPMSVGDQGKLIRDVLYITHSTRARGFFTGTATHSIPTGDFVITRPGRYHHSTHAGGFLTSSTPLATWGHVNENPKQARDSLSTTVPTQIPTITTSVANTMTTTNAYPVAAHTGVPDCNFQGLPSTGILDYLIHDAYAPNAYECQELCEVWAGCQSYSYRVPANTDFPNCELFSVKFDGVDPATGTPLVVKYLVPLMWYSNRRPSDGSGYCYAKPGT